MSALLKASMPVEALVEGRKPEQLMKRTGELRSFDPYTVDLVGGTCNCPQFAGYGVCKHERAVRKAVAAALELLLPNPWASQTGRNF